MIRIITCLALLLISLSSFCQNESRDAIFRRLNTRDGLSNNQVNCIFKDSQGFMWFGTESGLNRYDGFRFRKFFFKNGVKNSLLNNLVDNIQEDADGKLWIHTTLGYSIYDASVEAFDNETDKWVARYGINGKPQTVFIDSRKNMWIEVEGKGLYFLDMKSGKHFLFPQTGKGKNSLPRAAISHICETQGTAVVTFDNGTLARIDGQGRKVLWINRYITETSPNTYQNYFTFVDSHGNYWVAHSGQTRVWQARTRRWYESVGQMLSEEGYQVTQGNILVKDMIADKQGRLWIATDHGGLLMLDSGSKTVHVYKYDKQNAGSIPDNTLKCLYIDNAGALWVGGYKNGMAYHSANISKFVTVYIGDVCTITEDKQGNYWCGTNDAGIICYNPVTGVRRQYMQGETGLGSDVVVSSLTARDGSLWFGTFNGGLTHYKDGRFQAYRAAKQPGSLANDNVWALTEDKNGNIVIATLGGGLQMLNPQTGAFTTYNMSNSALPTDYLTSLCFDRNGNLVIGHSLNFSVMNARNKQFETYKGSRSGRAFTGSSVNQILADSRGLIWNATASGMNIYDPETDQLEELNLAAGLFGVAACSVVEDRDHNMWIASDDGLSQVKVVWEDGRWNTFVTNYNDLDGLQSRQFNYRSIILASNGDIVVGGQEGINIIPPQVPRKNESSLKALFSGLVLFDRPLSVGEKYNGRVVLKQALASGGRLDLHNGEDAFTILLASDGVMVPEKSRFLYRLKGFNDKWMMTAEGQPSITYTNLAAKTYTLEVKVVSRDGMVSGNVSTLDICVHPPFYLSVWAFIIYALLIGGILWLARFDIIRRQKAKFRLEQMEIETQQRKDMDEMKLRFFTNVSHELRTPLTLIISPLTGMIRQEADEQKRSRLEMIHRNSVRLLNMVNQILDFRKMDKEQLRLNVLTGDIVNFVKNICDEFDEYAGKHISLTFYASEKSLIMEFDEDKMGKIMNNLLSNAFKFTPDGGRVDVSLRLINGSEGGDDDARQLEIKVSDTGRGISDEDKPRVFDRFYQTRPGEEQPFGGSGIGLNLTKTFVEMHDGSICITDNPGGGAVFMILLPVRNAGKMEGLKEENAGLTAGSSQEISEVKTSTAPLREVLIVDDSDDFREFMCDIMSEHYKVREAADGKEALRMIEEHRPDIILSDVMMPEMDGNELCRRVKENPETADIPFVLITARLAQEHKKEGLESGADDYITKPFDIEMLHIRMGNLIKWHTHEQGERMLKPKIKPMEITSLDEKMVKEATEYVENNMATTDITVEKMSEKLNMSRVQLYKRLVSVTGMTPSEFIRSIQLQHAEQLLRMSQLSVSEIAYKVGFNNPRYFSKYFQERYSMTPSIYKKEKGAG